MAGLSQARRFLYTEINFYNFTLSNILVIPALSRDRYSFAIDYNIPAQGRDYETFVFCKYHKKLISVVLIYIN